MDLSSGIAGPVAAMLFADFGADVIKVESFPGRSSNGEPGSVVRDRGKQKVVLDTSNGIDLKRLRTMMSAADLLVVNDMARGALPPGDVIEITARNADLVVLNMVPFPGGARWHGGGESHGLLAATTGVALRQSSFSGGPVELTDPHLLYMQGAWGAACAAACLLGRLRQHGSGQVVTVSGLDAMKVTCPSYLTLEPGVPPRPASFGPGGPNPLYSRYQTADGQWVFIAALTTKFQERALAALDLGDLADDPRLGGSLDGTLLPGNRDWVRRRLQERALALTAAELLGRLSAADVPAGQCGRSADWLDHRQVRAAGMCLEVEDPERGVMVMPGVFVTLEGSPGLVRGPAAPLGPDLDRASWPERPQQTRPSAERPAGGTGRAPLDGIRVLDLGTVLAGPYAGHLLAELGADVVKVEPATGDPLRHRTFTYNRGLRGLAVDLKRQAGRRVLERLARENDVVIDNFRPGVLDRLGASRRHLSSRNNGLVTCSITAFGGTGPMAGLPGFDPLLQAMSGMMTRQGGRDEPVFHSVSVDDVAAAVLCCFGAVVALLHRHHTGQGQAVATSLLAASVFMQMDEVVRYHGRRPERVGGRDYPGEALNRYYRAQDGWVRVDAHNCVERLREVAAGRSCTTGGTEALDRWLDGALAGLSRDAASAWLADAGIPAVAARYVEEMVHDEEARGTPVTRRCDLRGFRCTLPGRAACFSRWEGQESGPPPGIGEHSTDILLEAGIPAEEVRHLISEGVVTQGGPMRIEWLPAYK